MLPTRSSSSSSIDTSERLGTLVMATHNFWYDFNLCDWSSRSPPGMALIAVAAFLLPLSAWGPYLLLFFPTVLVEVRLV